MRMVFLFVLAGLVSPVTAQVDSLSYQDVIRIALERNITLNQQENNLVSSTVDRNSAIAQFAPSAGANVNYNINWGNQFIQSEARLITDIQTSNLSFNASASLNLFNGFNAINNLKRAQSALDGQEHLVRQAMQDVIFAVTNQFLTCLMDQEILRISQANYSLQENQDIQTRGFVETGRSAPIEGYTQTAALKAAELELLRAQIQLRNDKAALSQLIQWDPAREFVLIEPTWEAGSIPEDVKLEELFHQALENRNDFRAQAHQERTAAFRMRMSKSGLFPSLSASAGIGSSYTDATPEQSFREQVEFKENKYVGLSLRIPLFNRLQNQASIAANRVIYENQKLITQDLEIKVRNDVLRAYQNFQDALKWQAVAEAQYEAASAAFELARERYQLGVADLIELTTTNQAFVTAETNRSRAGYNLLFQQIMLNYALGVLSADDIL